MDTLREVGNGFNLKRKMSIFERSFKNPILKPNSEHDWESLKVYNPGVIYDGGIYHMFYRARGKDWVSSIGYAVSVDGEKFTKFEKPVLLAEDSQEKKGVEDPRVTKLGDKYFMAYAAFDGEEVRLNIATSDDLKKWTKQGKAFCNFEFLKNGGNRLRYKDGQFVNRNDKARGKEWSKSGAIFPKKIGGKYRMLFGEHNIWLAESDDGFKWNTLDGVYLSPRSEEFFDCTLVEMGPPPLLISNGWLVLYHGVDKYRVYRIGFLILDINNPRKILYRSVAPIFGPQEPYELSGIVDILPGGYKEMEKMSKEKPQEFINMHLKSGTMPQVVFCNGAVLVGDTLRIYYGAGDTYICTATAKLGDILSRYNI